MIDRDQPVQFLVMQRLALAAATAVMLTACGSGQAAAPDTTPLTIPGIGVLPGQVTPLATAAIDTPGVTAPAAPITTTPMSTTTSTSVPTTATADGSYEGPIGRTIDGNRVLVIGDSIIESISDRYGGQLCARLVPRGWVVEVHAENGVDVVFGTQVLDARLSSGWDAAVVMLGNNYRDDAAVFAAELEEILVRLAPRPTLLFTVTEFEADQAEVNYVVRSLARRYDHVQLIEWAERTRDADDLLGGDGLHLSDAGRAVFADLLARSLHFVDGDGACLDGNAILASSATDTSLGSTSG